MERDADCLFWLGIESEGEDSEWQALIRRRLEEGRAPRAPAEDCAPPLRAIGDKTA